MSWRTGLGYLILSAWLRKGCAETYCMRMMGLLRSRLERWREEYALSRWGRRVGDNVPRGGGIEDDVTRELGGLRLSLR